MNENSCPAFSNDPGDGEPRLAPEEEPLSDLLWEAQNLLNQGHPLSVPDIRRTGGAHPPASFDLALHALEALQAELPSAAAPVLQPGDRLGRAEIRGVIGRGGMGIVYDAVEPDGTRVALKVLGPALAGDTVALLRFKREADLARRLDHPHVVRVLDAGEDRGFLYYKMERVAGASLQAGLEAGGARPETGERPKPDEAACRDWARRFADVADALHHAHQAGVIHRDVKPSNILEDQDGRLRLVDFGIARAADTETLTATSAILGTPLYMAPEQALGRARDVGPATDVYALAATLYERVTLEPLFAADDGYAGLITRIVSEPPRSPRHRNPAVPRSLETVLLRCLEKRPDARPASAHDLAVDLRRVAEGRPVRTRPVGRLRRWARHVHRRPLVAASAVAAVGILLAAMAVVLLSSPSSWEEHASPPWIRLRQDAWIQLFASSDAPVLARLDRQMEAFSPTTQDEADEARILRAWIAYKRLEPARALELLDRPAGFRSRRAAHYLRALVHRSDWRFDAAQAEVDRARARPDRTRLDRVVAALYQGTQQAERSEARARCDEVVEACPDYLPARIVQVELARADHDYEAARRACGPLLLMRPDDPTLLLLRGYVHRQARQWPEAERDFRAALAANPRYEEVRVALYYLLRGSGKDRWAEAARLLEEGLRIEPRSRWLLNARGWERHLAGNEAGAAEDFTAALRVDPGLALAQINLGNALLALGKTNEALAHWQRVIDDPRQPGANVAGILHERARYHWRHAQREAAFRDLRRALTVCYRPLVQDKLAMYLMEEQRFREALGELDRLLERVPANRPARARRARCRLLTGDFDGARTDIRKALSLWGEDRTPAWAWRVRAEVAVLAEDVATADRVLAEVAKQNLKRRERLALDVLRAGYEMDRADRPAESAASVVRCRKLLHARDPAEEQRRVAELQVRSDARQTGWRSAVTSWDASCLPAASPATATDGGGNELLGIWIACAREPGEAGRPGRDRPAGLDALRSLARLRLAGQNLDTGMLRKWPAPGDARGAWILGEAWLALGEASRARPLLEQARRELGHGRVHLHEAEALARLGRTAEAAAALGHALQKGVSRYHCLCRLTWAGVPWTGELREVLLTR